MYTPWLIIVSAIAVSEAAPDQKEIKTSCTGMPECFKYLSEFEKTELEYVAALHEKEKFNKLCGNDTYFRFFNCYNQKQKNCYMDRLHFDIFQTKERRIEMCLAFEREWEKKDASTYLKQVDSNCKEVVLCWKNLYETKKIAVGLFDSFSKEESFSKLCANRDQFSNCWAKKKMRCSLPQLDSWLTLTHRSFEKKCLLNDSKYFDDVFKVIKNGCLRDKCYNDLLKINKAELKKYDTSKDATNNKNICQMRDSFKKCEEQFGLTCNLYLSDELTYTKDILLSIVCTEEEKKAVAKVPQSGYCTGVTDMLKQLVKLENNIVEYLTAVHEKKNYEKLCRDQIAVQELFELQSVSCYFDLFDTYTEMPRLAYETLCEYFDSDWRLKDAVTYLKTAESNCSESYNCLYKLSTTDNIALGFFGMLMDDKKLKSTCGIIKKIESCINLSGNSCKNHTSFQWADWIQSLLDQSICSDEEQQSIADFWKTIKKQS